MSNDETMKDDLSADRRALIALQLGIAEILQRYKGRLSADIEDWIKGLVKKVRQKYAIELKRKK